MKFQLSIWFYRPFFLQSEMKVIAVDTETLKQHFGKKILELEEEKRKVQVELDLFNFK